MDRLIVRLFVVLIIWGEISNEIGLLTPTMFVFSLVLIGAAMMWCAWPVQLLARTGLRPAVLVWPVLVWVALAWWALPGLFRHFPALSLLRGVLMVGAGAGSRYASVRYPREFAFGLERAKGLVVPALSVIGGFADSAISVLLLPPAIAVVVGLPLRVGWLLIGTIPDQGAGAKMGDADSFRRDGTSDDL